MKWWERLLGVVAVVAIIWIIKHTFFDVPTRPSRDGLWRVEALALGLIAAAFIISEVLKVWRLLRSGNIGGFGLKDGAVILVCIAASLFIYVVFKPYF